jgi:dTDP-4-amino-4,6-dideoxygalactose transaminase
MVPRTKVNYRLPELLRACFVSERDDRRRGELSLRLAEVIGNPQVMLTASGRGALYVLLSCLPHRRVLVPAYTCKAVVEAARLAGKELLFGESEETGFNMAVDSAAQMLDGETILLATHQFGIPCDIHGLLQAARARGAFVIEDAAASLGTRVDGQLTGTFGDAAFFSFDSTKLVNVPLKAGFLVVRDPRLFARCREFWISHCRPMPIARKLRYLLLGAILVALEQPVLYRWFHNLKFRWRGRFTDDSADVTHRLGPFYLDRVAEWQAALLLPQIARLDALVGKRRRLYAEYLRHLHGVTNFALPARDAKDEWAPIRLPILVHGDKLDFYRHAARRGVDFAFSFTFIASPSAFVRSHRLAASVLDLPFYDRLTDDELQRVVSVLRDLEQSHTLRAEYAVPPE